METNLNVTMLRGSLACPVKSHINILDHFKTSNPLTCEVSATNHFYPFEFESLRSLIFLTFRQDDELRLPCTITMAKRRYEQ